MYLNIKYIKYIYIELKSYTENKLIVIMLVWEQKSTFLVIA